MAETNNHYKKQFRLKYKTIVYAEGNPHYRWKVNSHLLQKVQNVVLTAVVNTVQCHRE